MRANAIVLSLLLCACSSAPPAQVPIDANAALISQMSGRWVGEYSSAATGRSGSIVFELGGDQKTARGDVVMYSSVVAVPENAIPSARATRAADVLKISFVRASNDVVTGTLDPYPDPDTGATLNTTFTGRMAGDTIEGTYETLSSNSNTPQRGQWRVKRQKM